MTIMARIRSAAVAALKWTGISLAALSVAAGLTAAIVWDVDFAIVRDKWERAKEALTGPYRPLMARPGEVVTRFRAVEFVGGRVITAREVRDNDVHEFCFVDRNDTTRGIREMLTVGRRDDRGIHWLTVNDQQTQTFGLSATALSALVKALCSF